jgi:iron only hydrogenase large subunit-like protein
VKKSASMTLKRHLVQLNRRTVQKNIKNKLNKIGFGTNNTVWQGKITLTQRRMKDVCKSKNDRGKVDRLG